MGEDSRFWSDKKTRNSDSLTSEFHSGCKNGVFRFCTGLDFVMGGFCPKGFCCQRLRLKRILVWMVYVLNRSRYQNHSIFPNRSSLATLERICPRIFYYLSRGPSFGSCSSSQPLWPPRRLKRRCGCHRRRGPAPRRCNNSGKI